MKKDCLDKTKIILEIILLIAIVWYGNVINNTLKQKELNVKMIEVAVKILTTKPTKEQDHLREWAIDILDKYSEIPLPERVKQELKTRPIAETNYLTTESGDILTTESGDKIIIE